MMRTTTRYIRPILLTLSLTSLVLVGCSKKDETAGGPKAANGGVETLLQRVPANLIAIAEMAPAAPSYQKIFPQAVKDYNLALEQLNKDEAFKPYQAIGRVLSEQGVAPTDPAKFSELVGFSTVAAEPAGAPFLQRAGFGAYMAAKNGVNTTAILGEIQKSFEHAGMTVTPDTSISGATQAFLVKLVSPKDPAMTISLFVATNGSIIAIGNSAGVVAQGFMKASDIAPANLGMTALQAKSGYQKARKDIDSTPEHFSSFFVDLDKLGHEGLAAAPQEQQAKLETTFGMAGLDVLYSVHSATTSGDKPTNFANHFVLLHKDGTTKASPILSGLKAIGTGAIFQATPAKSFALINIDGAIIRAAMSSPEMKIPPQMEALLQPVRSLSSLGMALRPAQGPSPFPEVGFLFESADGSAFSSTLKQLLQGVMSSSGLPSMGWQAKDIQGLAAEFMQSPLGVGVYLAKKDNLVGLASSEAMLGELFPAASRPQPMMASLSTEGQIVGAYLDFPGIAGFLESLSQTLMMFTGGQKGGEEMKRSIETLKSSGSVAFTALFHEDRWDLKVSRGGM